MSQLFQCNIWYNTFLIQTGIVPLCDMLYTEPHAIITLPAQRTHEAAREGVVPLCEVNLWNPRESRETPHSGLMRQPTKEGPVSGILATVKLECKSFETMGAAGCLKSIPVFLRIGFAWSMNPL